MHYHGNERVLDMLSRRTRKILYFFLFWVLLFYSAINLTQGHIVIFENGHGTGFTMDFKEWNGKNKCELSAKMGNVFQIEVALKSGEVSLAFSGKNGSKPYTGNNLESGIFTITVSESDDYVISVGGEAATGRISVKFFDKITKKQIFENAI